MCVRRLSLWENFLYPKQQSFVGHMGKPMEWSRREREKRKMKAEGGIRLQHPIELLSMVGSLCLIPIKGRVNALYRQTYYRLMAEAIRLWCWGRHYFSLNGEMLCTLVEQAHLWPRGGAIWRITLRMDYSSSVWERWRSLRPSFHKQRQTSHMVK